MFDWCLFGVCLVFGVCLAFVWCLFGVCLVFGVWFCLVLGCLVFDVFVWSESYMYRLLESAWRSGLTNGRGRKCAHWMVNAEVDGGSAGGQKGLLFLAEGNLLWG